MLGLAAADPLDDSVNLSSHLFRPGQGLLESAAEVNGLLTNVVVLLGEGRISTRRAAVITYALSLILCSIVAAGRLASGVPGASLVLAPSSDAEQRVEEADDVLPDQVVEGQSD